MKAVVRTRYGSPDVLELKDVAIPVPTENQVLIRIAAASVNPLDWHILRGKPFLVRLMGFGLFKPKYQIPGADFAGTVEAVGHVVSRFKVGDEVFGETMGTFAEYACASQDKLVLKPANLNFEQAAAVPVAALTALQALRVRGEIQPGQRVLVTGAAGGVGTFAVQIAKSFGAHVTAVCSGEKRETVLSIGADEVIDYTKEDYSKGENKYDLILDNAAFGSIRQSARALNPIGTYVLIGGSMVNFFYMTFLRLILSRKEGKKITGMMANINQSDLALLKNLLETGKIEPVIGRRYQLSDTAEAIRYIEEGHARGKVVITIQI